MHKWIKIIRLVIAGLMILVGACIYVISRCNIVFFQWLPVSVIDTFREYTLDSNSPLKYFVVYCLPDGLWYGALLLVQSTLIVKSFKGRIIYWISIVLPFIWEMLQVYSAFPGTFDPMDLLVYFLILIIVIIGSKKTAQI